ncbi:RluA family pseudouridine synthase [Buchnera aphidicola]|uniref:RluA family pseudouridine synthase n=1 Tax=Buchnera aphidicola TaxID=9 RepID=UPI0031B84984
MIQKKIIIIDNNYSNQRIDNFIKTQFYKIPKSLLYKIIRIGNIQINNKKVHPSYKLQKRDVLSYNNILQYKKTDKKKSVLTTYMKKNIISSILYEDKYLLIINKPCGIAVHGGSGIKLGIIEMIRLIKPEYRYIELIHRLDRDTSGILMLSKKRSMLRIMHEKFREKKIKKKYIALIHGNLIPNKKIISFPLKKTNYQNKKKVVLDIYGKKSITVLKVKKRLNQTTFIEIIPKTGRTHQIRFHTSHIGYPIVFDKIYGNKILDYKIDKSYKSKKMLLHAYEISFLHPYKKKIFFIQAPLCKRFKKYL